ncbi:MAG: hypothetical protein ACKOQZ_01430 [Actinomycetota bacterium]
MFGSLVGVTCVLLMAPQQTEFGAKVALLAGLTIMTAVRPLLERFLPTPDGDDDNLRDFAHRVFSGSPSTTTTTRLTRSITLVIGAVILVGGLSTLGRSAQGLLASEPENLAGRMATSLDPATFPDITVDDEVINWNHEINVDGARAIVLTLAENLALESQAIAEGDESLLVAVDHGDRLDAMRAKLRESVTLGMSTVTTYDIDSVRVTLLVPFGRQDGLSLGMVSRGTKVTEVRDRAGVVVSTSSAPFETMWAMRRATGSRWLNVAELPVPRPN